MRIISLVVLVGGGVERGDYKQNSEENYDPSPDYKTCAASPPVE